ncbi:serine/threonine-protein kinase [Candidatus Uabimicrobium amorphum]|uniref:Serine/threonine protein kinase n=1 Tax=Uabimicrobium amorphum TaxID=2596890 RepID=A0A5S9ILN7_UABAM|nr:serine/threonine-protein kinase [Candidatus Uabimicrobium amorphum]BBM84173.1 serine/threonine protein kinase [Candidatus Uabimicrobium amorphum]
MIKVLMKVLQNAVSKGIIKDISVVEKYIDAFVNEEMTLQEIEDQIYEGKEPSIFYRDDLNDLVVENADNLDRTVTVISGDEDVDPAARTTPLEKDPQSFTIESEKNNAQVQIAANSVENSPSSSSRNIAERALKSVEILQETNFDKRYEVKEEIGRGGMGAVYLVSDKSLMRKVAMKVHELKNGGEEATRFTAISLEQFIKEARLNGLLVGEYVLPIYEVGIIPKENPRFPTGGIYYTMRYLESAKTLRDFLQVKGVNNVDKFKMFRAFFKICTTIKHAHDQGFIHCDLKPDNIMFADISEELFVIDWGLSKLLGRKDNYERYSYMYTKWNELDDNLYERGIPTFTLGGDSAKVGTPKFMSPEQARGDIDNFNEATDIYGLGGILYYMFTLKPPNFTKTINIEDVLRRIASQDRSDRRDYSALPEEVRDICKKCLQFRQEDRFQHVGEILECFRSAGLVQDTRLTKKCIFCGNKVYGKYCTHCGKSIFCRGCNKPLSTNDKKFCSSCGRAFSPWKRIGKWFLPD